MGFVGVGVVVSGELDDYVGVVFFQFFFEVGEFFWIGICGLVIVVYMCVVDCGFGFECFLGVFDLFGDGDWNCGIMFFMG